MKQQGRRWRTGDNFLAIFVGNSFQLLCKQLAGMSNAKCPQVSVIVDLVFWIKYEGGGNKLNQCNILLNVGVMENIT